MDHQAREPDQDGEYFAEIEARAGVARPKRASRQSRQHGKYTGCQGGVSADAGEIDRLDANAPTHEQEFGNRDEKDANTQKRDPYAGEPDSVADKKPNGNANPCGHGEATIAQSGDVLPKMHGVRASNCVAS